MLEWETGNGYIMYFIHWTLGWLSTHCMPGIMVEFERPWDSRNVVPFPSSLYLEQLIWSEYIPVPLLQNWCQRLVLYSTKQNQSVNYIFTVLLISFNKYSFVLFLYMWAHYIGAAINKARCLSERGLSNPNFRPVRGMAFMLHYLYSAHQQE